MEHDTKISIVKGGSAWGAAGLANLGISSWGDAAGMAATVYTILLIGDWLWKKWKSRRDRGDEE